MNLIISYLTSFFIPYAGFFPYRDILETYHLPKFLSSFANFDGIQYILVAENGYSEYTQAYFPLYPLIMHYLGRLTGNNYLLSGIAISNIAFLFGYILFRKFLELFIQKTSTIRWVLILLIVFPTSFFFNAVYTEGLFFLLFIGALFAFNKEKYVLAAVAGYLAATTKLLGVFIAVPIFIQIVADAKYPRFSKKHVGKFIKEFFAVLFKKLRSTPRKAFIALSGPILGLATYSSYLFYSKGDPLFFFNAQPVFGANRSTELILLPQVIYRYIKIFITAQPNFQYFMAATEFVMFHMVFFLLLWDLWKIWKNRKDKSFGLRLGLNIFSMINLILPTLTGTLSSIPRYTLLSISMYIVIAELKNKWIKTGITLLFFIFHIVLLAYFVQGYFIG